MAKSTILEEVKPNRAPPLASLVRLLDGSGLNRNSCAFIMKWFSERTFAKHFFIKIKKKNRTPKYTLSSLQTMKRSLRDERRGQRLVFEEGLCHAEALGTEVQMFYPSHNM